MVMYYCSVAKMKMYLVYGWSKFFRPEVDAYCEVLGLMNQQGIASCKWPLLFLKHMLKPELLKHIYQRDPVQLLAMTKADLVEKNVHLLFTHGRLNCADLKQVLGAQLQVRQLQRAERDAQS